jgi:hypothetical protein
MADPEDQETPSEPVTADEGSQTLALLPRMPEAPSTPSRRPYLALGGGIAVAGIVTIALLSARSSARESLPVDHTPPATQVATRRPAVPATVSQLHPHWSNANQARWVSNHRKSVAFELAADRDVPVWMRRVQPLLVVRCLEKKADVFVYTDSPARIEPEDENHTISIAFDNEAATTQRWMDSEEHDALFAPNGAAFARRLAQSHTLRFGFTPHNAAPVTMQFSTAGFDKILERVAGQCRM